MKKVTLFALSALAFGAVANAQAKLDAPAAQLVGAAANAVHASRSSDVRALTPAVSADEQVAVIVTMADGNVLYQIERLGGEVVDARGDMAIVRLTPIQIQDVAELSDVLGISLGYENHTLLLNAREETNIDAVHAGIGLDKAYDGTGVLCGLMDTGIDPNHINFLDEDGKPRVTKMWVITGSNGAVRTLATEEKIASYSTDLSSATHGTHVLGIMAGGYKGNADFVATVSERTGDLYNRRNYPVKYYGAATGAELAPCAGTLDGNNILIASGNILDYAKEIGKPAVMNLSLGHNYGPHDGSTASCKYLAEIGKEMLVCVSAGNEAGTPMSIQKQFTANDKQVKTTFGIQPVSGQCDIWSKDNKPVNVTFVAVDTLTGDIKYSYKFTPLAENPDSVYTTNLTGTYYTMPEYVREVALDSVFGNRAGIIVTCGVNPDNNRYNCYMSLGSLAEGEIKGVVPGVIVEGEDGTYVDMYASGNIYFIDNDLDGFTYGNDKGSINDMACGDNILSVAAYTNVEMWPTLSDMIGYTGAVKGKIASFSSYGTTVDGRQLPHIAAPGQGMVSSYSYYYQNAGNNPYGDNYIAITKSGADRDYYWHEMSGTSMSSPLVAGILALWLQADPTLTMDEVKQILSETARQDAYTAEAPERFGYGKIDALAGIKRILGINSVSDVKLESEILVSEVAAGCFDIFAPGASKVEAALYSMSGAQALATAANGENLTLDAAGAAAGVYVLRVTADGKTETRKVVIR